MTIPTRLRGVAWCVSARLDDLFSTRIMVCNGPSPLVLFMLGISNLIHIDVDILNVTSTRAFRSLTVTVTLLAIGSYPLQ